MKHHRSGARSIRLTTPLKGAPFYFALRIREIEDEFEVPRPNWPRWSASDPAGVHDLFFGTALGLGLPGISDNLIADIRRFHLQQGLCCIVP